MQTFSHAHHQNLCILCVCLAYGGSMYYKNRNEETAEVDKQLLLKYWYMAQIGNILKYPGEPEYIMNNALFQKRKGGE